MSTVGGAIGTTLTSGIQDIAAFLPLLGTERCAIHVGSALTKGYLYASSAPMSIFGSLGVVSTGFKTFLACFSCGNFEGAKILGNMGFEPEGENLSLIMVEGGTEESEARYVIENRIDDLIKELNIDDTRITDVFRGHKTTAWNVKMIVVTAILSALSIIPYIFVNLRPNDLNLRKSTKWVFPILRSTGGFLTATLIQILIQRRITAISKQYLAGGRDVEAARAEKKTYQMDLLTWPLLLLLLIGLLASVVGYVGCFSIVQNSPSITGPVSWLCLEGGLSLGRLALWAWNPKGDDAPPLEINLKLDKYELLPTCNKYNEEIVRDKVLPLTRARDFLKSITSFVGLIKPFSSPDLSLYYTLTRKCASKSVPRRNGGKEPENAKNQKLGERTLYITVFDHKERTTRVYTQDNKVETIYSTKLGAPLVDVGHHRLEVEIDAKIVDLKGDPVCSDSKDLESLRNHHQSILEHIQYRLEAGDINETYAIKNSWTMKVDDTKYKLQELRGGNSEAVVVEGRKEEQTEESLASDYFLHSSFERDRQLLDDTRVKWIARRMDMITGETEKELGMEVEYRVDKKAVGKKPATKSPEEVKEMLSLEKYGMELLLVYEVREWEKLFWHEFKAFLGKIGNGREEEEGRLTKEWKANCWKRLDKQKLAALKRMADVDMENKDGFVEYLGEQWVSISQLFEGVDPDIRSESLSKLRGEMGVEDEDNQEMSLRIEKEIEDTIFRLKRGTASGSRWARFHQFWDDDLLFECRYSRSKWLKFNQVSTVPLEVYSHALKENKNITHITFGRMNLDFDVDLFVHDLPWVTSITLGRYTTTPAVRRERDLLFIKSTNNDLTTFAKKIKLVPTSTYIFSDTGVFFDVKSDKLGGDARVLISFVPPTSGKRLLLRVKYSGDENPPLEVTLESTDILESTNILLNPSSKSSLTIDDITLYPIGVSGPSDSDYLSFKPGVRNEIYIQFKKLYDGDYGFHENLLHDIELLDENGQEYMPRSASLSKPSN